MRYKELIISEASIGYWDPDDESPIGYWNPKTKKLYHNANGHHEAAHDVLDSGDFPRLTNAVEKSKQEIMASVGVNDWEDFRLNYDEEWDEWYDGEQEEIISDFIHNSKLVRLGDLEADGFIINNANEEPTKVAVKYFLKRIIKDNMTVYIDFNGGFHRFEMPMDRQKLMNWLSS